MHVPETCFWHRYEINRLVSWGLWSKISWKVWCKIGNKPLLKPMVTGTSYLTPWGIILDIDIHHMASWNPWAWAMCHLLCVFHENSIDCIIMQLRCNMTPIQYKDCLSRYGNFHCKDKTVVRHYLHNVNSYTGEMTTFLGRGTYAMELSLLALTHPCVNTFLIFSTLYLSEPCLIIKTAS